MTNNTDPVRGLIHAWRTPEPDNGEPYTEYDEGFDAACEECADALEKVLASAPPSAPEPEVHSYDPTEHRESVTIRWPDGKCLGYVLDRTRYTDNLPPSATVGVVCIRLNGIGEGGPYPVVNGVCVLPQSVAENLVASTVGQQMKRELLAQWASYKQPAAPSGEAVGEYVRATVTALERIGEDQAVVAGVDTSALADKGRSLLAAPQQPAGVDEAAAVLADLHPFLFGLKLAAPNEEKRAFIQERIDAVRRASAALAAQQQEPKP